MKKIFEAAIIIAGLSLACPLFAGVVYEIETTDHTRSPPKVESIEMAAEGRHLKMGIGGGDSASRDGEMIFRSDRREVVVTDDKNQSYQVMDQAFLDQFRNQMGGQMDGQLATARRELHKRLEGMNEEQRRVLEQALGHPEGGAEGIFGEDPQPTEVRKTKDRATHGGYPCARYEVVRSGEMIYEIWVTDWSKIEGGETVRDLIRGLADFFSEMEDAGMKDRGGEINLYAHFTEIDGFPVVTRSFEDGELEDESVLRSARRRTLDPAEFEPPSGYKRRSMFPQ